MKFRNPFKKPSAPDVERHPYRPAPWYSVEHGLILTQAHCDSRILHAKSTCQFCDRYPEAQDYRITHGINFTNTNDPKLGACPAVEARGETLGNWYGNQPETRTDEEIAADNRAFWQEVDKLAHADGHCIVLAGLAETCPLEGRQ